MDNITNLALEAVRLKTQMNTPASVPLIEQAPDRLDLRHSLAVTLVMNGEAGSLESLQKDDCDGF